MGVDMMCSFGDFFYLAGPGECCMYQLNPMILGNSVPTVAFPVEEMQQAERAGSSVCWFLHGTFRAACPPSGEGWELCLGVSQQCGCVRSDSTGLLWAWISFLALPKLLPLF